MNKFLTLAIATLVALSIWACVDNANKTANSNSNSNANANATASKAAPALDTLMAQEKAANEAYTKGDGQFFENLLSDKFAMNNMGSRAGKADTVKMISSVKCEVKSVNVDEGKLAKIDDDTYAVLYKTSGDGTCTHEGKKEPLGTMRAGTVWIRSGDKWQPIWHGETPIVEQKEPGGSANANSSDKKEAPKPPAKADEKKAPEKPAANSNTTASSNSNSNSSAAPADPNIDAMVAVEKSGWEAWKARDAKKLEDVTDKDVSFVDLFGAVTTGQAEVVKGWTTGQCDIKSTTISDTSGQMISPTLGMIMFKGSADGTCNGQKITPLWGNSFYKKEGDTWKQVFGFESMEM